MRKKFMFAIALALLLALAATCGGNDEDPTPTASESLATQPPDPIVPVIFVPGVAGTELGRSDDLLWANTQRQVGSPFDGHLLDLRLDGTGAQTHPDVNSDPPITFGDAIGLERITLGPFDIEKHFYDTTRQQFLNRGYVDGETFFVYSYDWRKDVDTEARGLADLIDELARDTEASKVDIVAHSMGGLVTLAALDDPKTDGDVRKLVTLGTPVLGATKALGVLEYRALCFTEYVLTVHCVTNPVTVQAAIENFPGVYELLPTEDFHQAVGSPLRIDGEALDYDDWTSIVRTSRNSSLLDLAQAFHSRVDVTPADSDIDMLRIYGKGKQTPLWFERRPIVDCLFLDTFCPKKLKYKIHEGSGDGTVPEQSASLHNDDTGFDRRGDADSKDFAGKSHMALANDPDVLAAVFDFLLGEESALIASQVSVFGSARQSTDDAPSELDGISVTVYGAVWGHASQGGHITGPVALLPPDVYYAGIPGSSYQRIGDTQQYYFAHEGDYALDLDILAREADEYQYLEMLAGPEGVLERVVLLDIERFDDGEPVEQHLLAVERHPDQRDGSLRLQLQRDGSALEVAANYDQNGDGEFEQAARVVACYTCREEAEVATPTPEPIPTATNTLVPDEPTEIPTELPPEEDTPTPTVIVEPPAEPRDLTFEVSGALGAAGVYSVALVWTPGDTNAQGFRVWRIPPEGYAVVAELGPSVDSYKETIRTAGQYCYAVEAYNEIGSNQSLVECVVVGDGESPGPPQLPVTLSIERFDGPSGEPSFQLTWQDFSINETHFNVYRGSDEYALHERVDRIDGVGELVVYQDFDLSPGSYCYFVTAQNQYGESARTDSVCATIPVQ